MGRGDVFNFYEYTSDDTTIYALKLSAAVAEIAGFTTLANPRSAKVWPYHAKNCRHVYGMDSSGKRTKVPIATPAFALYVSGGTFTLAGDIYNCEGAIGEKRKLNAIS